MQNNAPVYAPVSIHFVISPRALGRYVALVRMLKERELHPCVIFTFSKKRCEQNADALGSLDLTTAEEKSQVGTPGICNKQTKCLFC